jgi:hypothetical protein
MSQISPVLIRGVLVRGVLGARPVCPGTGCAASAGGAATRPTARVARKREIAAATAIDLTNPESVNVPPPETVARMNCQS